MYTRALFPCVATCYIFYSCPRLASFVLLTPYCRSCINTSYIFYSCPRLLMSFWLVISGTATSHVAAAFPATNSHGVMATPEVYAAAVAYFVPADNISSSADNLSSSDGILPTADNLFSSDGISAAAGAGKSQSISFSAISLSPECCIMAYVCSLFKLEYLCLFSMCTFTQESKNEGSINVVRCENYSYYTFIHKTCLFYTVEIMQNATEPFCHSPSSDDMYETSAASVALPVSSLPAASVPQVY